MLLLNCQTIVVIQTKPLEDIFIQTNFSLDGTKLMLPYPLFMWLFAGFSSKIFVCIHYFESDSSTVPFDLLLLVRKTTKLKVS